MQILADPTNFGNKPGDGPLRISGQPGSISTNHKDVPSLRSPQAEAQLPSLKLCRDVWGGTEALRNEAQAYLPQHPGEDPAEYLVRLMRSVFFNAFKRTIESLTGLVMNNDPVLDVPAMIEEHWENIDLSGTHGDVFVRDLLQDALIAGHCAILVEYPEVSPEAVTDGTQARLEAEGRLRPYWLPIKKDDLMSWWSENEDGHQVLQQVVIRERGFERAGEYRQSKFEQFRVIRKGAAGVTWQVIRMNDKNEPVVMSEGVYANQVEIPLVEVSTSTRVDLFVSDPPLRDLAYMNVAHYQQTSDYFFSIHKTCIPFVFGAGIDQYDQNGNPVEMVIGPNTAVLVSDPNAKMAYISHDGASLGSVKAALDDLKSEMGSLGLEMLAPQKRSAETATAKRIDKAGSDSALSTTARRVQDAIEEALVFHARYMNIESGGSVELNRDFEGILMEAPVMSAFAQLVAQGFPPRPVLKALQAGGRIADDEDLEELEMEWMAGVAAEEERKRQEAEMRAGMMEEEPGLEEEAEEE